MKRVPLALVALVLVFPATSEAKVCPSKSVYSQIKVTNVSCAKGKKVIRAFFENGSPALGFDCREKQFPGGVTTTCTKGDKRVRHFSAD